MAWDSIFREKGRVYNEPREEMGKVVDLLKEEGAKRVLDLGCGSGRHTVMLAESGFEVYGADISEEGLRLTKKWLERAGLEAILKKFSFYEKFPFEDDFFDAVISTQAIHHSTIDKIRFCISEIERVLKANGIVFIAVAANKRKRKCRKSKLIAPRTYLPLDGIEEGLVHYIYNKVRMREDFKDFKILDLHRDGNDNYCLLGRLKPCTPPNL